MASDRGEDLAEAFAGLAARIWREREQLSLRSVRRLLEARLHARPGTLDDPASKHWVADAVQRLLQRPFAPDGPSAGRPARLSSGGASSSRCGRCACSSQGLPAAKRARPSSPPGRGARSLAARSSSDAAGLPMDVLLCVLSGLDDASLAAALQACSLWSRAAAEPSLWWRRLDQLCSAIAACPHQTWRRNEAKPPDGLLGALPESAPREARARRCTLAWQQMAWEPPLAAELQDPKQLYAAAVRRRCLDCQQPVRGGKALQVPQTAPEAARLRVCLCSSCLAEYKHTSPRQKLVTKTTAMHRYRLQQRILAAVPFALAPNPIDSRFTLMQLFTESDVRKAAVEQWGSEEAMLREKRRPHWETADDAA